MAGYNHHAGMSNNAVTAYNNGIKPLSKITADDLKSLVSASLNRLRFGWLRTIIGQRLMAPQRREWYNEVNFYDPAELAERSMTGKLILNHCAISLKRRVKRRTRASGFPARMLSGAERATTRKK